MNFTTGPTAASSLEVGYSGYKKRCVVLGTEFNVTTRFPSDGFLLNHKFLFGVCAALTVLTVLMNSATVLTFWRSSKLKNRISYFLIMLQSLFDTFVGLFNTSFLTYYIACEIRGNVNCDVVFITHLAAQVLVGFSLTSLFLINLERYIGILHPLAHKSNWSKKRILKYGACHLVPWLIFLGLMFINKTVAGHCLNGHLAGYCILTAYMYIRIYRCVAVAKLLQVQTPSNFLRAQHTDQSHDSEITSNQMQRIANIVERKKRMKETKLVISCFMVVACFFMCYMPIGLVMSLKVQGFLGDAIRLWALVLSMSNSLWNSLIFVWRDRVLRGEMKKVMSEYFCD